jgi:UDP-N-acetylglucosamine 2-epimerase (non-hydrolysing)
VSVWHVTGARPNFPKAAPVVAALARRGVPQRLVHTGQHYDDALSEVFFRELVLPRPDVNLGVGSGSHADQTAMVLQRFDELLCQSLTEPTAGAGAPHLGRPDLVLVYGDVNSTMAAALACAKRQIPVGHVEAGLRSFDASMPEEINRRVTDTLTDLAFATSADAVDHLRAEGMPAERIHFVGNPMIDTLLTHLHQLDPDRYARAHGLPADYVVATLHRPSNVDDPVAAAPLVRAVHACADRISMLIPMHPRGRAVLDDAGLAEHPRVTVTGPLGYLEFLSLLRGARAAITDSGGVQEETTVLGVPCLTLRPNTERPVTITDGTNRLVSPDTLPVALAEALSASPTRRRPPRWDGHAGERIADVVCTWLTDRMPCGRAGNGS